MVAKVFLLLMVVSASFSIGQYDDVDLCRQKCDGKCFSQSCMSHCNFGFLRSRDDRYCGEHCSQDCFNCYKDCGRKNSKRQEVMISKSYTGCVKECGKNCHKACLKTVCANIKSIFRKGECMKDCVKECSQDCPGFCNPAGNLGYNCLPPNYVQDGFCIPNW